MNELRRGFVLCALGLLGCAKSTVVTVPDTTAAKAEAPVASERAAIEVHEVGQRPPWSPCTGCFMSPPLPHDVPEENDAALVQVYYGTDRNRFHTDRGFVAYGAERDEMSFGECTVSIPRDHRMGEIERRPLWKFWANPQDPEHYVVLMQTEPTSEREFFDRVKRRVMLSTSASALLFVHGYNVTFADAALRTAQMSYDLGFDGAPLFFSWPSRGEVAEYPVDETNAEWARAHLARYLYELLERTQIDSLFLIAHSMGNRVLTGALLEVVAAEPALRARIREVILAAPDIDADVFKRDIAPRLIGTSDERSNVTLYASANDKALLASKQFHGYPRAGDAGSGLVQLDGLDTIDASPVDTDWLGHSYYGDNRSVIADMFYLIHDRIRACERAGLRLVQTTSGPRCTFRP